MGTKASKPYPTVLEQTVSTVTKVARMMQALSMKYPQAFPADESRFNKEFSTWNELETEVNILCQKTCNKEILTESDLREYDYALWILHDNVVPLVRSRGIPSKDCGTEQPCIDDNKLLSEERQRRLERIRNQDKRLNRVGKPIIYLRTEGRYKVTITLPLLFSHLVTSPVCMGDNFVQWDVEAKDNGRKLWYRERDGTVESYSCLFYELDTEHLIYRQNLPQVFVSNFPEANKFLRWMLTTVGGFSDEERDNAVTFWLPFLREGGTVVNATSLYNSLCPLTIVNLETRELLLTKRIFIGIVPKVKTPNATTLSEVLDQKVRFVDYSEEIVHALEWGNVVYNAEQFIQPLF